MVLGQEKSQHPLNVMLSKNNVHDFQAILQKILMVSEATLDRLYKAFEGLQDVDLPGVLFLFFGLFKLTGVVLAGVFL